ncbi:hypothetical protein GCM10023187_55050 [Nibrella viscosa]|uniref:LTD domain-containing protein n=1 Tax=Nibrella viscosa TaxID=1084524 RepID=A0ABP8L1Z6_9BACT
MTPTSGNLSQVIHARLANTVAAGPFSGTITHTANSTLTASVTLSGQVNPANVPTLLANPTALNGFSTTQGTPSTLQSYTLTGSYLSNLISVSAPNGFEVSSGSDANTFASATTLPAEGGVVYVRLSGASVGSFSGAITNTSGTTSTTISASGQVNEQSALTALPSSLTNFTALTGTNSAQQVYTLTGSNLTASVSVSAPAGFEVSADGSTFATSTTVAQVSGAVSQTIAVRLASSATPASYSGTITNLSGTASANVAVSGSVSASVTPTSAGTIVISQVYGGGGNAGATYKNDFIELFNRGGSPVDVTGWSVQYAGATGTGSWQVTPLSGTIQPGKYYLIQQAAGNGGTTDLPTPDVIANVAMAAGSGKVALVKSTTPLSGSCATGVNVVDFVGYGSANCAETSPTASLTNTTAAIRKNNGYTDTDNNANDFEVGAPTPRGSLPSITATPNSLTGANGLTYIEGTGPASKTLAVVAGSLNAESGSITASSSSTALTVSPATLPFSNSALVGGQVTVQLAAGLPAGTYSGTITLTGGGATQTVPVSATVNAQPTTITFIHDIQGSGSTFNTAFGGTRTIEGVVTRTFTGATKLNGFYVQEEDSDADTDPATSEGIFVFDPTGSFSVSEGDKVRVTGTVAEFTSSSNGVSSSLTQLGNLSSVTKTGTASLPTAVTVTLPIGSVSDLERYEGMLVNMRAASGNLAVTEYFQLGRYGQVVLSATGASDVPGTDARLDQYTQFSTPSVPGYTAYLAEVAKRKIILDDGSTTQNPDPIIFGRGGQPLSASNTLRGGDQVESITAVLDERLEGYRLQTTTGVNFLPTNERPTTPAEVGGTLKVAGFNVLNYFNDLDSNPASGQPLVTYNGITFEPRGAETPEEFTRQRTKLVQAITLSGADVMALNEMENNGFGPASAIQDLVNGLNTATAPGTYTFVNSGYISTDAITVAMIYKPAKVTPVGTPASLSTSAAFSRVGRQPLAQTFRENATNEVFTVVANHWKSKGSSAGGVGDTDKGDGQGASNGTRTQQAQDLVDWLNTKPTGTADPDYLILGDLNAYALEDPVKALEQGGYTNLVPNTSYSYVFDGFVGALDHALGSASLTAQVTGKTKWHINADEPSVLDYNTNFKTVGLIASLYNPDQFRTSDHDPVLIGLALTSPVTALSLNVTANPTTLLTSGTTSLSATVTGGTGPYNYIFSGPGNIIQNQNTATVTNLTAGVQTFTVTVADATTPTSQTISATVSVTVTDVPVATLSANPTSLTSFTATQGNPSASQSYTLTAANLTALVSVSAPAGVVVSTDNSSFTSSLTLPQSTTSAVIYARLTGFSSGTISGAITNVSGSATATVAVSGTVSATTTPPAAATLATWTFEGDVNTPTTVAANTSAGNAAFGTGVTSVTYVGGSPGRAYTAAGWSASTSVVTSDNDYLEFTVAPAANYTLDLTTITVAMQRSGTGPANVALRSSADDYASNIGNVASPGNGSFANASFTLTGLTNRTSPTTFRLYGYGSTGTGGTLRFDNLTVIGTVNSAGPPVATLTASPVSLTGANGLSYVEGNGPASKTLSISGSNLNAESGDITASSSSTALTVSPATLPFSNSALVGGQVTVQLAAGLPAGTYSGTITLTGGGATQTVPVSGTVVSSQVTITLIHDIQGSGSTFNTAFGGTRTIEGVVTRTFTGATKLNGFYVQEEDSDADTDPATSEGIFVFDPTGSFSVSEGDKVRVTGIVAEFTSSSNGVSSSLTQLGNLSSVTKTGTASLPTAVTVTLPVGSVSDLERYEGMLVNMRAASGNLAVTEYFQLGRYGQVVLSATGASDVPGTDARLDQYTQFSTPSVPGYTAYLAEVAKRKIILDDGSTTQNPDPIIFGRGGQPLSASNTLRGGDQVESITAVLDERLEGYRLQTTNGADANFQPTNPRPANPPVVGGTLKAGSFNVLNYFNTFGTASFTKCDGGSIAGRGATNQTEFTRQRDKVIGAIINSGVDVMGLNEMQNNGFGSNSAIQDLINGLNAVAGANSYTFVNSGCISSDAITVAIIYKPAKVTPLGASAAIPSNYGTGAFTAVGRRSLAQTFRDNTTNGVFTLVTNHWKSKGSSSGGAGDTDSGDGQSASNGTRTRQAQDLVSWLATRPTGTTDPDYLIVGDLNAYAKEDPLTTLENGGYTNLVPNTTYSYVFDGFVGALDHALGSSSLQGQVSGADKWHINADEPIVLDYNTENKSAGQISSLYSAAPYRASDHDPVIIGLNLTSPATALTLVASANPTTLLTSGTTSLSATVTGGTAPYSYSFTGPGTLNASGNTATVSGLTTGVQTFTVTASDATTPTSQTISATVSITVNAAPISSLTATATPGAICTSGTTNLSVSVSGGTAPYTYAWSGPGTIANNTSANTTVSNLVTTGANVFTIVVTDKNGQTATTTATVTVNALPVASVTPSSATICQGQSATLTAAEGASYLWSNGATTQVISATATGTYSVTISTPAGCSATASAQVTVNPLPTAPALASVTAVQGSPSVVLSTTSCTGTLVWSGAASGTGSSITVSTATPGSYVYNVQCKVGECLSNPTSATVTITPAPISSLTATATPNAVCVGGTATLTVSVSGGQVPYTYAWSGAGTITNASSATATVASLTATGANVFTVLVTDANSQTATTTATVTVNALPVASVTPSSVTVCQGQSATLTASGGGSYLWSTGATTATISAMATGTYSVTVTSAAGCSATASAQVTVNPLPTAPALASVTAVQGSPSVVLSTTSCTGTLVWSGAASGTGSSITVATTTPGSYVYNVQCKVGECLSNPTSVTVTVISKLSATASASPASIFPYESSNLVVNAVAGTAPYTYVWNGPGTITNGTSATATVSGLTAGVQTFTVVVTDATSPVSQTVAVPVSVTVNTPANTPPVASTIANQTATVGVAFSMSIPAFTDAETPKSLVYSTSVLPDGLSFNASKLTISGTPSVTGITSVTVTATDPGGLTGSASFTLSVVPVPNTPPVASTIASQTATVGVAFSMSIPAFTDAETPKSLVYSTSVLPDGLSFNASKLTISGTPSVTGITSVTVTATDPGGLTGSASFSITVNQGNTRPYVATPVSNTTIAVGQSYSLDVTKVFTDNETPTQLSYGVSGLPKGLSFSTKTNTISGAPSAVGVSVITLTATDPGKLSGTTSFTLTVVRSAGRLGTPEVASELEVTTLGNPVQDELTVAIRGAEGKSLQLRLTDLQGRVIESRHIESAADTERQTFDVRRQATGVLLLQAITEQQVKLIKLMKQ